MQLEEDSRQKLSQFLVRNGSGKPFGRHPILQEIDHHMQFPDLPATLDGAIGSLAEALFQLLPSEWIEYVGAQIDFEALKQRRSEMDASAESAVPPQLADSFTTMTAAVEFRTRRTQYMIRALGDYLVGVDRIVEEDEALVIHQITRFSAQLLEDEHKLQTAKAFHQYWSMLLAEIDTCIVSNLPIESSLAQIRQKCCEAAAPKAPEKVPTTAATCAGSEVGSFARVLQELLGGPSTRAEEEKDSDSKKPKDEKKMAAPFSAVLKKFSVLVDEDEYSSMNTMYNKVQAALLAVEKTAFEKVFNTPEHTLSKIFVENTDAAGVYRILCKKVPADLELVLAGPASLTKTEDSVPCGAVDSFEMYMSGANSINLNSQFISPAWLIPTVAENASMSLKTETKSVPMRYFTKRDGREQGEMEVVSKIDVTFHKLVPESGVVGKTDVLLTRLPTEAELRVRKVSAVKHLHQ